MKYTIDLNPTEIAYIKEFYKNRAKMKRGHDKVPSVMIFLKLAEAVVLKTEQTKQNTQKTQPKQRFDRLDSRFNA